MKYYLAIDLGASSGRHIISYKENNDIILKEVYRFKTEMDDTKDGLVWDIPRIFNEIKTGIKKAFEQFPKIESISIDTWGVDYVLMNNDKEMPPFYAYRNERCKSGFGGVHKIISQEDLYKRCGIQIAPFDTLYQLYDDKLKGRLDIATDYLMIPCYFTYKLTGIKTHEYTMESTGNLLDVYTKNYDYELLDKLSLPRKLFSEIKQPGYIVGDLLPSIQEEVGGNTKVVLCASHDTASAFEAVDTSDDSIILSSGTWSLLGIKSKEPIVNDNAYSANYTNEGGVGYIRFLKNIMGMYIANRVRAELNLSLDDVAKGVESSSYKGIYDVNDPSLNAPKSMKDAILNLLKDNPPKNDMDLFAAIFNSQAYCYKIAIDELERITNKKYKKLYVVGGGAKNVYLNKLIKKYIDLEVVTLPIEATAIGNIKMQMKVSE